MVLTLVEKLKVDHGIPVAARISTDSSDVLTAPKTVVEDHDVISDTTTESLTDSTSSVKSRTSGNKKERTSSRKHSVSEENDQQVDGDKKSKTKKKGSKKGSKRGSLIEVERVVLAETEPATPIVIPPPSVAPARRPSLLFRNHSKSFPAAGTDVQRHAHEPRCSVTNRQNPLLCVLMLFCRGGSSRGGDPGGG
jgi:hypothetical protein